MKGTLQSKLSLIEQERKLYFALVYLAYVLSHSKGPGIDSQLWGWYSEHVLGLYHTTATKSPSVYSNVFRQYYQLHAASLTKLGKKLLNKYTKPD
jgi:hypothetical protein